MLRGRELSRVAPLAIAYALVMATSYVLKPVRNALFLDRQGIGQLPVVAFIVAIAGALAGGLYARMSGRVPVGKLVSVSLIVILACLAVFRLALPIGGAWIVYGFYVWVSLYGLVATSLMWLLANSAFDAREARRFFGPIGSAGIVGAVIGGLGTRAIVGTIGTENLLLVCIAVLAPCVALVRRVPVLPTRRRHRSAPEARGALREIARSPLLRDLAIVTLIAAAVAVVVDIQFNEVVGRAMPERDQKTAFFGTFFALLSGAAFVAQLVLTPRILAVRGVGAALLVLPLALGLGSAAFWFVPGLAAAILAKGSDGALRHSIHKAASEILLVPVPAELKQRTKLTLDASISTFGEGMGALLVLVATAVLGLSYRSLSIASVVLVAGWLALHPRLRRAYLDAFRRALERREIDPSELRTRVADVSTLGHLTAVLGGGSERQLTYALDLLVTAHDPSLVAGVTPLADHPSAEVRKRALRILVAHGASLDEERRERLRRDPDADVRLEAMRLEAAVLDEARLASLLRHDDLLVQAAALDWVAQDGTDAQRALIEETLVRDLLGRRGDRAELLRAQLARALGGLGAPALREVLQELTLDPSPTVLEEVARSAGRTGDVRFVGWLIDRLAEARLRKPAREALAQFGKPVLGALDEVLRDEKRPRALRIQVPRVIAEIGRQESANLLLDRLVGCGPLLELPIVRALHALRVRNPELRFDVRAVEANVLRVAATLRDVTAAAAGSRALNDARPIALLRRALAEKTEALYEEALRLLALVYPARDMMNAYHGIVTGDPALRASAIEFLDNVLAPRLKAALLPAMERAPADGADPGGTLERLYGSPDPWLRACAVASARAVSLPGPQPWMDRAREDPDPIVREVAC